MSDFRITTRGGKLAFRPGEWIEGDVNWNFGTPPQAIEIRLLWFTRGRGTSDASIVESSRIEAPATMGDAPFRFRLPEGPHSFAGQLIALSWAIEAMAFPNRGNQRLEFRMSPFEREIVLPAVEKPMTDFERKAKERAEALMKRMSSNHTQR